MLGDRVRIGEEKRKINDLRSECIAAFTHWGRQAKYSSSSPSHCSILLQGKGFSRGARRPEGAFLLNNSVRPCWVFLSVIKRVNLDPLSPSCLSLHLYQCRPSQQTTQVESLYNIWAHAGPWCTGACSMNCGGACSVQTNGPLDSSLMLEREKEWDIAPKAPSWALSSVVPGIPDATSPLRPARHPWGTLSAQITPRKSVQRSAPRPPPPLLLLPCQPFPLIWSPVCGRHMGMSFLCVSVSAAPSVHDTHSKDAPWSSEHKENKKGLRAPSDGNVILQAFYRHLNCPRAYLYMHTQAHAHAHNKFNVVTQG